MTVRMGTFVFATLVAGVVCAEAPKPQPWLAVEGENDLGTIPGEGVKAFSVKLVNHGSGPVAIKHVVPSCGCTAVQVPAGTIKPGETLVVPLSFNPKGFAGKVHKTVRFESDDPVSPKIEWTFEANVRRTFLAQPRTLMMDVQVDGGPVESQFRFVPMERLVDVKSVGLEGEGVTVPKGFAKVIWGVKDGEIQGKVSLDPRVLSGEDAANLREAGKGARLVLETVTGEREEADLYWTVHSPIQTYPARLSWVATPGMPRQASIRLEGRESFQVQNVSASHPQMRTTLQKVDSKTYTVRLSAEGLPEGNYKERVLIRTDYPKCELVIVQVNLIVPK